MPVLKELKGTRLSLDQVASLAQIADILGDEIATHLFLGAFEIREGQWVSKKVAEGDSSVVVRKQADGTYWITAVSTAALKDREGETFDTECIDYDAKQAKELDNYPEFRVFHRKEFGVGKVEKMRRVGIFAVDEGTSYNDAFSLSVCEKMLEDNPGTYRCSRGFVVIEASGQCPHCSTELVVKENHFVAGFKCPNCKSYNSGFQGVLKEVHFRKARTFDVTITDIPAVPWTSASAIRKSILEDVTMTKKELKEKLLKAGVPEELVDERLKEVSDEKLKELTDVPFAEVLKEFKPVEEETPDAESGEQVFVLDPEVLKDFTDIVTKVVHDALEGLTVDLPEDIELKEVPGITELQEEVAELKELVAQLLQKDELRLKEIIKGAPRSAKLRIQRYKAAKPTDDEDAAEGEEDSAPDEEDAAEGDEEKPSKKMPPWLKKQLQPIKPDVDGVTGGDGRVARNMTEFISGGGE